MTVERHLDVSELEAPEPLVKGIAALESLNQGEWLHFYHRMKPCKLYAYMDSHGFDSKTCHGNKTECELFIWRIDDPLSEQEAKRAASKLQLWSED